MYTISHKSLENIESSKKPALLSLWHKDAKVPPQTIFASPQIVDLVKEQKEVHHQELLKVALSDDSYTVERDFSATALNAINSLYYSSCDHAFDKKSDLATLYVKNRMVQYSMLHEILHLIKAKEMTIKEICCGGVYTRWQHFDKYLPRNRKIHAILSDFTMDIHPKDKINSLNLDGITFGFDAYDMRKPFAKLDESDKVDLMLVTYGFDSVWNEGDAMYVKEGGEWHQIKYRVRVSPTAKDPEKLIGYLRQGYCAEGLPLDDFDDVVVETIAVPVDLDKVQYGEFVKKAYGEYDEARVSMPGLLVERVREAFEKQIKKNGYFMIGEVATYPLKEGEKIELTIADYNTTGRVGKYKVEDFYVAEMILESMGFDVEVHDIAKLAAKYGKKIDEDTADTWLMVVTKG
ncbi:MAG: hypothetical protein M3Q44_06720 [bacterium]|nr:hypothetical protein [bacterium]